MSAPYDIYRYNQEKAQAEAYKNKIAEHLAFYMGEDYEYIRGLLKLMDTSHVRRNAYGFLDIQTA